MNAEQLIAFIEQQTKPQIPITVDLWSVKEIAAFLKMSESSVRERIVTADGFPKPKRLKTNRGLSHPRWKAAEVIRWAG